MIKKLKIFIILQLIIFFLFQNLYHVSVYHNIAMNVKNYIIFVLSYHLKYDKVIFASKLRHFFPMCVQKTSGLSAGYPLLTSLLKYIIVEYKLSQCEPVKMLCCSYGKFSRSLSYFHFLQNLQLRFIIF